MHIQDARFPLPIRPHTRLQILFACLALLTLLPLAAPAQNVPWPPVSDKTKSTLYGPEKRAIAQANAEKHEWARQEIDEAVAQADRWVDVPDEELWKMIWSPTLKRAIGVSQDSGCPNCGDAIYGDAGPNLYAFQATVAGHPWKVRCPNCQMLFPTNDFKAFHDSGVSPEDGLFHYELADQSLLYNTEHPDPDDPLHKWGVDDGNGFFMEVDGETKPFFFIATYMYRGAWRMPVSELARAYAFTGKPIYAHKATILLDRFADVYPNLDGGNRQLINVGGGLDSYWNGIIGPDYWTAGGWAGNALAYDMIYEGMDDMPETMEFIRRKAEEYTVPSKKETIEDVRRHIERRMFEMRFHNRRSYQANGTISEMAEAKVDLVLRGDYAKEIFPSFHMPRIVPPRFLNDDGSGNERSVGYDGGAFSNYAGLLEQLYELDPQLAKQCLKGYPKFEAAFNFWPDIWCIGKFIPNIGDSSGEPWYATNIPAPAAPYVLLHELTGNPKYAKVALIASGGKTDNIHRNIWMPDPQEAIARAKAAYEEDPSWDAPSLVKPDYRLGILRAGEGEQQQALWLFYSPHAGTSSHSHFDALHFGLFAFGHSPLIDHGYPQFTGGWPSRWEWTSHTRSHALVTVDGSQQNHCNGGDLLGFGGKDGVQFISAQAPCTYDAVSVYKRTLVWVETAPDENFIVDVFRVTGGRQHIYSVPMLYGDMTWKGLDLEPGEDFYAGYVEQVHRGPMTGPWYVDAALRDGWEGDPVGHLRVHGGAMEGVLLTGQGETRKGNDYPERLPYIFIKRDKEGGGLETTFVTVYEPYRDEPYLAEDPLKFEVGEGGVEVSVELRDGERYRLKVNDTETNATRVQMLAPAAFEL